MFVTSHSFALSLIPLAHSPWAMASPLYLLCVYLFVFDCQHQSVSISCIIPDGCSVEPQFHLCCFPIYTHILHSIADTFNSTCAAIIKLSIGGGAFFRSYFTFLCSLLCSCSCVRFLTCLDVSFYLVVCLFVAIYSWCQFFFLPFLSLAYVCVCVWLGFHFICVIFALFSLNSSSSQWTNNSIDDAKVNQINSTHRCGRSCYTKFRSLCDFLFMFLGVIQCVNRYSMRVLFSYLLLWHLFWSPPLTITLFMSS